MTSRAVDFLRTLRGAGNVKEGNTGPAASLTNENQDDLDPLFNEELALGSTKFLMGKKLEKLSRDELKAHLAARKLPTEGSKKELIERLKRSLDADIAREESYHKELDEERRMLADLEERGSVYVVGANGSGQLGVGDMEPRKVFTVVPQLMGMGVCSVSTGIEITFAVNEDHNVYVFGSLGIGPTGNTETIPEDIVPDLKYNSPVRVEYLKGEDIVHIAVGSSHAAALSTGGDAFVWGIGSYGRLGLGHERTTPRPTLLAMGIPPDAETKQIACGQSHSVMLTNHGTCYTWGHVADGRLGVGTNKRLGFKDPESRYFPIPTLVAAIKTEFVAQVACGSAHTMVRTDQGMVWSWGFGGGGRLGHGDVRDRYTPQCIEELKGSVITEIACGYWHSAALVAAPPLTKGRMVYTWGSGYCGQLGQGHTLISLKPAIVEHLLNLQVFAVTISCGSHHNAIVDTEGELWTWGSNKYNCLGRTIEEKNVDYTPIPGHVGGFGAIVDGVGRGMPRSVSCGREYTVVATYPYQGPTLEVATEIMEDRRHQAQEIVMRQEAEAKMAERLLQRTEKFQQNLQQTQHKLCAKCKECPGFEPHAIKNNLCQHCSHSSQHHVIDPGSLIKSNVTSNSVTSGSTALGTVTTASSTFPALTNG